MDKAFTSKNLVGIFDSGLGGLSVLREIHNLLPSQPLFYIGDQSHVPYGKRQLNEIRKFSVAITQYLLDRGAKLIVVACNTASAAALQDLRGIFPDTPFVGMEPAVKPASRQTHNGIVGVLATPATFQGKLYNTLVERFAKNVTILKSTLPGLVEKIEQGNLNSPETRQILEEAIKPMVAQGADTLVLGCTHFPFVLPLIREIAGPHINVIDPAPAIARRTKSLLQENNLLCEGQATTDLILATTGNLTNFKTSIRHLLDLQAHPVQLRWDEEGQSILQEGK